MKKFKKISAMLMASVITAGTVSAMSSSAIITSYTKEKVDEILEDAYILPLNPDVNYSSYKKSINCLVETEKSNSFFNYWFRAVAPDVISAVLDLNVDADSLIAAMKEICPDAEVVRVTKDADSTVVCVKGVDNSKEYYLPYVDVRKKDVTYDQAVKLYDLLNATGKLKEFNYTKELVDYELGTSPMNFSCDYELKIDGISNSVEKMEKYIAENDLNWTINIHGDSGDAKFSNFSVTPDKRMTAEEIFKLDKQLKDDLGIKSAMYVTLMAGGACDPITIDMHNNIKGDANDDGELRLSDAITILQAIGNPDEYSLTAQGRYNADIYGNRDGITAMDAVAVQQKLLGLE